MANMSNREFEEAKKYIMDTYRYGNGTKESYVRYLKGIIAQYDDGYECAKRLDAYNSKWTVVGTEIPEPRNNYGTGSSDNSPYRSGNSRTVHNNPADGLGGTPTYTQPGNGGIGGMEPEKVRAVRGSGSLIGTFIISVLVVGILVVTGVNGFFSAFMDPDNYIMMYAFIIGMILAFIVALRLQVDSSNFWSSCISSEIIITIVGSIGVIIEAVKGHVKGFGMFIRVIVGPILVLFSALIPALIVGLIAFLIMKIYNKNSKKRK